MALVNQKAKLSVWMLLVSVHWRKLWLMLNTDAISYFFFKKNNPLVTINCKMVTKKNFGFNPLPSPLKKMYPLMIKRLYI